MWISSLLFNKFTYFSPFMVVSGGKKIKSSCTHEGHCPPNHLARWMFHCWESVLFFVSCSSRPPNPIFSNKKLTYRKLVRKKYPFLDLCVPASMSFGKVQTFLFFFASVKHGFLAGLHNLSPNSRNRLH